MASEEVISLFAKGMASGMAVELGFQKPKKYQVLWKEWSYQDNCEYQRAYQYDSHEDALKVQDYIVKELRHFAIVMYKEGESA